MYYQYVLYYKFNNSLIACVTYSLSYLFVVKLQKDMTEILGGATFPQCVYAYKINKLMITSASVRIRQIC